MNTASATAEKWFGFESGHLGDPQLQWPEETARMWNEHLRGQMGMTTDEFSRLGGGGRLPIAAYNIHVFFPDDVAMSGHLFYIRKLRDNMVVFNYGHCRKPRSRDEYHNYCGAGYVAIYSKYTLLKLAEESPLFVPIWEDLKGIDPDEQGIYVADAPDAEWVASIQPDEQRLYAAFRDGMGAAIVGMETATSSKEAMACLESFERKQEDSAFEFVKATFQKIVSEVPEYWEFWESYVLYLLRNKMPDWAYDVIEIAQRQYPECRMIDRLGVLCCMDRQDWDRAEWHLKRYWGVNPWDAFVMTSYARVAYQKKDFVLAANLYGDCMEHGRLSTHNMLNYGESLFHARRQEESLAIYERVASSRDSDPLIFNNMGMALASMGQLSAAIKYCRHALELDSSYRYAWDSLGFTYLKSGQYGEAVSALLKAVELDPNYPDAWRHLLHAYDRLGDADKLAGARKWMMEILPKDVEQFDRERGKDLLD